MNELHTSRWLTIRADATPATGAGHAMRCLSVAEQWRGLGGHAEICGEISLGFVVARARDNGISVRARLEPVGNDLLLVDVYDESERRRFAQLRSHRLRVLVDDLMSTQCREFDAVWNPNAYGEVVAYRDGPSIVLAGEEFVPIRADLPKWSVDARGGAVAFGGGALSPKLASLVCGLPAMTGERDGWALAQSAPPGWQSVDTHNPWKDLQRARWLVMAAGSMLWEAAAVGIPVVVCIIADNQVHAADWAGRHGATVFDLRGEFDDQLVRQRLADAGRIARQLPALTSGARRVADRLWEL